MRRLPPLHALRAFEAAARLSSVTAAAEELRVSHSAVSQHIKSLEAYFKKDLFIRKGRRIAPTPSARAFLSDIKSAFDLIAISSDQFDARSNEISLTVNTTPSFALRWLIPKASEFQIANPKIRLIVHTSEKDGINHLDQSYDFVIRRFPMEARGHKCFSLIDDINTPLVSPAYLATHKIDSIDDLTNLTLLHMKSRPEAWRRWFAKHTTLDTDVIRGPFLDHFFLTLQSAISGVGVALGPLCMVEEDLAEGRLITPLPDKILKGPGFHILVRSDKSLNRYQQEFLTYLFRVAGKEPPKSLV